MRFALRTVLAATVAMVLTVPSPGAEPTILILPSHVDVDEGEDFVLTVAVDDGLIGLTGYSLGIDFDESVIGVFDVTEGGLPTQPGGDDPSFFYWTLGEPESASLGIDGAALGRSVDGPGELALIRFDALAVGTTFVTYVRADLRDIENESISVGECGCSVTVWPKVEVSGRSWSFIKALYR